MTDPAHYTRFKHQPIDVIEDWGLNFRLANVIKYIARAEHKGERQRDLEKALWYLQREIDQEESCAPDRDWFPCGRCCNPDYCLRWGCQKEVYLAQSVSLGRECQHEWVWSPPHEREICRVCGTPRGSARTEEGPTYPEVADCEHEWERNLEDYVCKKCGDWWIGDPPRI